MLGGISMKKTTIIIIVLVVLITFLSVLILSDKFLSTELLIYSSITKNLSNSYINIMRVITSIGSFYVILIICLTLLFIPSTTKQYGIPIVIVVLISFVLNIILKNIFIRPRPDVLKLAVASGYSFPSGHAMVSSSLYSMLIFLGWKNINSHKVRIITSVFFFSLILLIGFSRIILGVHYFGDIMVGWMLGLLISLIIYQNIDRYIRSR